jgi:hypothetical protein
MTRSAFQIHQGERDDNAASFKQLVGVAPRCSSKIQAHRVTSMIV